MSLPRRPKTVLAPLAGFTDAPFRKLCSELGAELVYTEMASAAGLAHGSVPTRFLLSVLPGESPAVAQIFGSNEDDVAAAAREIDAMKRFCAIDLNSGCPMPRIRQEGSGSALLEDPEKIGRLLKAIKAETSLPVTLKTRPGPRPARNVMLEIVAAAQEAGVSGITLHARYASRGHSGPADLDLLARCVQAAKVPVTGNGGVVDRASFDAMAQTGVAAVMVGRAALDRPEIFRELSAEPGEEPPPPLSARERFDRHVALMKVFAEQLAHEFPDARVPSADTCIVMRFRTHLFRYFAGMDGAARMRRDMNSFATADDVFAAVSALRPSRVSGNSE